MRQDLLEIRREARSLGIDTKLDISIDGQGEYTVEQYGKVLSQGYGVTDCRIYALGILIEEKYADLDRAEKLQWEREIRERSQYSLQKDDEGRIHVVIDGQSQTYGWTNEEAHELAKDFIN